jgi:iron complex outermembrane recepter protein
MSKPANKTNVRLIGGVSATALAAAMMMMQAQAQEKPTAAADNLEAIVVTGFRASLESSIRTKKSDLSIVESVTAEDIGKLPDVSIAESIARLPGLTAQRLDGRDQVISIRGLGPEFSTALLNGRQQVTTGDNRGVEFDQYPSELLNAVKVYKTPYAALIGQGLAGTVDLQTIRPLSQSKRILSLSGRYEIGELKSLNPDSSRSGYRASATYVDQFADNTIGIALGVAVTSAPTQNERFNAWGYPNFEYNNDKYGIRDTKGTLTQDDDTFAVKPQYANYVGAQLIGGAKPYVQSNKLNRYGAIGTIEYKPSDSFSTAVDVFYSKFKEKQRLRGIEFPLWWGGDSVTLQPGATVVDKLIVNPTFTGVFAMQRNDYNQRDAETISVGWNTKAKLTDSLRVKLDASYSRATRTDFLLESYTGTGFRKSGAPDTITVSRQANGVYNFATALNYADPATFVLTDAQGWGGNAVQTGTPLVQAGFLNRPSFKDELKSLRADIEGDFAEGAFKGWEAGVNFGSRKKTSTFTSFFLRLPNGATAQAVPTAALLKDTVSLDFLGVPKMLTYDPLYVYNNVYTPQADIRPGSIVRDYNVKENVLTGYAQLNLDTQLGAYPVKGNIGVQVVRTKQSSSGSQAITINNPDKSQRVVVLPISGETSYTDFLPSLSLNVEADNGVFIRFAASRTMARARLDQLRVQQNISFNQSRIFSSQSPYSSDGGNIALRPYMATGIDLSVEKYFGGSGYVALAGYFKHITKFVGQDASTFDFGPIARASLGAKDLTDIGNNGGFVGPVSRPVNNGNGYLRGVEATASIPFSLVTPMLEGFGFIGNISYTDSDIKFDGSTVKIPVPGLSKWTQNATLYFEKSGFELRGSFRHRSRYLGEISAISASRDYAIIEAEGIVDAQIGYTFQEGTALSGLSIQLQGKNLTDEPYITYGITKLEDLKDPRFIRDYQRYGRSFLLGATYKF